MQQVPGEEAIVLEVLMHADEEVRGAAAGDSGIHVLYEVGAPVRTEDVAPSGAAVEDEVDEDDDVPFDVLAAYRPGAHEPGGPVAPTQVQPSAQVFELTTGDGLTEEMRWQVQALCAQTDPEAFFPEKGGSTREAKRVCLGCDVRGDCLEYAMAHDERFGIWGGLSERERRRLRKRAV